METADDIKTAQAAYAARPFAVRWVDSHAAVYFRFHTLDDAYEYISDQWARVCKSIGGSSLWSSYLETPAGRVQLAYVMLCNDVSNR